MEPQYQRWLVAFDDGRFLAIGYAGTAPGPLRVERAAAWTWESRFFAMSVAMRICRGLDWRVMPADSI